VSGVITGKRASAKEWWFTYDENAAPPSEYKGALVARARRKSLDVENLTTGKITRYDSAKSAGAATLGIHKSQISLAIKNKKPLRKYMFRFVDENQ
jgi:hypothetical protein